MQNAKKIFKKFEKLNILIIGDVMIDRYLNGKVERISPEAPVPVVRMNTRENRLGGAANVALNIKAMGAIPLLLSVIGKDDNATIFKKRMKENGLDSNGLVVSKERMTTVKTRVIASGQHLLRVDSEDQNDLSVKEEKAIFQKIKTTLKSQKVNAILFQDYNKGVLTASLIEKVIALAKEKNIPTTVDPKKKNFFAYKNTTLFKPNLKEIRESLSTSIQPNIKSLKSASEKLREKLNQQFTMITLSEKGIYFDDGKSASILPTFPRSIADVSGAGDTVISLATLGLAAGLDLKTSVLLSNLAGGQVCEKVGVVPVDRAQLLKEYMAVGKILI